MHLDFLINFFQVSVDRDECGIEVKEVEADIYAPAIKFSNNGITYYKDYAVSGAKNRYFDVYDADSKAALKWADSYAKAMNAVSSRGSSSRQSSGSYKVSSGSASTLGSSGSGSASSSGSSSRYGSVSSSGSGSSSGSSSRFASGSSSGSSGLSSGSSFSSQSSSRKTFTSGGSSRGSSSGGSGSSNAFLSQSSQSGSASGSGSSSSSGSGSYGSRKRLTVNRVVSSSGLSQDSDDDSGESSSQAFAIVQSSKRYERPVAIASSSGSSGQSGSEFSLQRRVSVKSPEFVSSSISHFNPAQHKYEATGEVSITRSSSGSGLGSSGLSSSSSSVSGNLASGYSGQSDSSSSGGSKRVIVKKIQTVSPSTTFAQSSRRSSSGGLSLNRRVSVKNTPGPSGTISHFSPALHNYEADGEVIISRGSSSALGAAPSRSSGSYSQSAGSSTTIQSSSSSSTSEGQTIRVQSPVVVKQTGYSYTAPTVSFSEGFSVSTGPESDDSSSESDSGSSSFSVFGSSSSPSGAYAVPSSPAQPSRGRITDLRQVSVKYPTRETNVIPFFVPADHKYEATSIVKIDREV